MIKIVEAHLLKAQNKFDDKIAQLETEIASASEKDAKETLTKKKELEEEKKAELEKLVRENLQKANEFLSQKERKEEEEKNIVHNLLESARDPLSDWLDEERGASFKDNDAIRTHAARFEDEFLEDMQVFFPFLPFLFVSCFLFSSHPKKTSLSLFFLQNSCISEKGNNFSFKGTWSSPS